MASKKSKSKKKRYQWYLVTEDGETHFTEPLASAEEAIADAQVEAPASASNDAFCKDGLVIEAFRLTPAGEFIVTNKVETVTTRSVKRLK